MVPVIPLILDLASVSPHPRTIITNLALILTIVIAKPNLASVSPHSRPIIPHHSVFFHHSSSQITQYLLILDQSAQMANRWSHTRRSLHQVKPCQFYLFCNQNIFVTDIILAIEGHTRQYLYQESRSFSIS